MVELTTCEFCGANVHRESPYCPGCGVPGPGSTPDQRHEWVERMGASPRGDGGALAVKERPTETAIHHRAGPPPEDEERWPEVTIEHTGNGLAVAAFVLGMVGIVLGAVPILFFLSLPCGILAVVFGVVGRRTALADETRSGRRLAVAGVILGCLTVIMGLAGMVVLDDPLEDVRDELEELDAEVGSVEEELNL